MGQKAILDQSQNRFLELVLKQPYLLKNYYWTGGTVLAKFYLQHRESYDIDLFTEDKEVHLPSINKFVSMAGGLLKAKTITHRRFLGLQSFIFKFTRSELKVDFNYYPFLRINRGKKWKGLEIDSLQDISVNKIHTLSVKPRARDFVDIFFILKKENWSVKKLISLAKAKFDWHIDPVQLGHMFSQAGGHKDIPIMLKPFDKNKMDKFFLKLAKGLGKEIFKD